MTLRVMMTSDVSTPPHEVDVSWDVLRRITRDWAGTSAELEEVTPLIGGSINTTLLLTTTAGRAVLKISPHRVNREYADERRQLGVMAEAGIAVPRVFESKIGSLDDPFSYILMQYIEGTNLHEARHQCSEFEYDQLQAQFGELIAEMHQHKGENYRRITDAGGEAQVHWPAFFRSVYDSIWSHVEKSKVLPARCRKHIHKIHERLERTLAHTDCPRLIHGDLWGTNVLVHHDGNDWSIAALIDPNCKYAHAEAEIAYLELFHTVTPSFIKAYQKQHKLNGEYHRVRKWVYQMYYLLDHVNLFGQEYVKPLDAAVERAMAVV